MNNLTTQSCDSNSSTSVGIALQLGASGGGLGFTGNVSNGGGNGSETTYTNTHIAGADSVNIKSGSDTNVKCATLEGKQVTATVGGNAQMNQLMKIGARK